MADSSDTPPPFPFENLPKPAASLAHVKVRRRTDSNEETGSAKPGDLTQVLARRRSGAQAPQPAAEPPPTSPQAAPVEESRPQPPQSALPAAPPAAQPAPHPALPQPQAASAATPASAPDPVAVAKNPEPGPPAEADAPARSGSPAPSAKDAAKPSAHAAPGGKGAAGAKPAGATLRDRLTAKRKDQSGGAKTASKPVAQSQAAPPPSPSEKHGGTDPAETPPVGATAQTPGRDRVPEAEDGAKPLKETGAASIRSDGQAERPPTALNRKSASPKKAESAPPSSAGASETAEEPAPTITPAPARPAKTTSRKKKGAADDMDTDAVLKKRMAAVLKSESRRRAAAAARRTDQPDDDEQAAAAAPDRHPTPVGQAAAPPERPAQPKDIFKYWKSALRGRPIPALSELALDEIAENWPETLLLKVTPGSRHLELEKSFSRAGAANQAGGPSPAEPGEQRIDYSPEVIDWVLSQGHSSTRSGAPARATGEFDTDNGIARYSMIALPLGEDGSTIDHILCHLEVA